MKTNSSKNINLSQSSRLNLSKILVIKILKKDIFKIILIIFASLLIRTLLSSNSSPTGDILVHQDWAKTLNQINLDESYFYPIWTNAPPSQPPLMMLAFKQSQQLYESRNTLSRLHNLTKFPPSSFLLWYQEHGQILNLKLWEFLGTLFLSLSTYFFIKHYYSPPQAFKVFALILLNPVSIFINAIWGQNDLLPTFFMYTAFYLLLSNKPSLQLISPPLYVTGLLFKPTIALLLPLFAILYLKKLNIKKPLKTVLKILIPLVLSLGIVALSFKPFTKPDENIFNRMRTIYELRIQTSAKGDQIASVSGFNFYSLFFNIDQTRASQALGPITLKNFSIIIVSLIYLASFYYLLKQKKDNPQSILFLIFFTSFQKRIGGVALGQFVRTIGIRKLTKLIKAKEDAN